MNLAWELAAVGVLILLNAFFVAAEYALVTVRRTRMHELAHERQQARARQSCGSPTQPPQLHRGDAARRDADVARHRRRRRAGARAAVRAGGGDASLAVLLGFFIITFMHVVDRRARAEGRDAAATRSGSRSRSRRRCASFFLVVRPLVWVLQKSTEQVLGLFGIEPPGADLEVYSEPELKMLVSSATEHGELEAERAGDALQGLRLRRQGGRRRDGAAARGRRRSRSTCRPRRRSR